MSLLPHPSKDAPTSLSTSADGNQTSGEDRNSKFQIFLGGSCNPTTWRQTVAIPYLETKGISYYNPQVDDWTPDVVKTERHAKKSAQILLFVIDKQTRSTVSLVESAYMAGDSKKLVLVIYPFDFDVFSISDTTNETTSNIVETRSELTKTNLSSARHTKINSSSILKSSMSSSSTKISATVKHASRTVRMNNETINSKELLELRQARAILQNLIARQNTPVFYDIPQALHYISGCLARDVDSSVQMAEAEDSMNLDDQKQCIDRMMSTYTHSLCGRRDVLTDIYLSLDDENNFDIETTLTFMLREKGLTYNYRPLRYLTGNHLTKSIPIASDEFNSVERKIDSFGKITNQLNIVDTISELDEEINSIRASRVILFIITNRCRGLSIMVLASHFMALFKNNVVLCIQYLEEPCSIDGEVLTETAVADYNRGRVYLCDYAVKSKVPVFKTINEAVECCIQKCHHDRQDKN